MTTSDSRDTPFSPHHPLKLWYCVVREDILPLLILPLWLKFSWSRLIDLVWNVFRLLICGFEIQIREALLCQISPLICICTPAAISNNQTILHLSMQQLIKVKYNLFIYLVVSRKLCNHKIYSNNRSNISNFILFYKLLQSSQYECTT